MAAIACARSWQIACLLAFALDSLIDIAQVPGSASSWQIAGSLALRLVAWGALWVAGPYGIIGLSMWVTTRRFGSQGAPVDVATTRAVIRIARSHSQFSLIESLLFTFAAFGVAATAVFREVRLGSLVAAPLILVLWLRIRTRTPPVLLVLGPSTKEAARRHLTCKRMISPLRAVSMLEFTGRVEQAVENELDFDCLRTGNPEVWQQIVRALIRMARIVVIDGTTTSPCVNVERDILLDGSMHKTVWIWHPSVGCPLLDSHESLGSAGSGCCRRLEQDAMSLVSAWTSARQGPSHDRPVAVGPSGWARTTLGAWMPDSARS